MAASRGAPPILDFSPFYGDDATAKANLVEQVRQCCLYNGFFQITGHRVPAELQRKVLECSKRFFNLPLEQKDKINKGPSLRPPHHYSLNISIYPTPPPPAQPILTPPTPDKTTWNRGYELLRSQMLEPNTSPELKEGLYIGEDLPTSHPYFINKKLNSGPNQWPEDIADLAEFKQTSMDYYHAVFEQAKDILRVLALTLGLDEGFFDSFTEGAVATMRFLHYPPQPADGEETLNRGIGAHTDFGAVTLLLQDEVDGLQVLDKGSGEWVDVGLLFFLFKPPFYLLYFPPSPLSYQKKQVPPTPSAYVVNLGNLFMRWSNDKYISNIHRVINKSGRERYSIPFFFSGNPDYVCECLPNCLDLEEGTKEAEGGKYAPASVEELISKSYKESYGRAEVFKKEAAGVGVGVAAA
ncbi:hypothetical protein FQN50_002830 [Emmonsiellopsis sp. PD_5]|nr:hypothetical protein FQN50_002830 [Emmonsiellopsis sp. PD_5]